MTKKSAPAEGSGTYFEQIPVDIVKRIARIEPAVGPTVTVGAVTPALERTADPDTGHFHAVQFYNDSDALCRIVGDFLGEGLEQGAVAVLIVTPDHSAKIDACLRARALDVAALKREGAIATFDARETLGLFMMDGMPHPGLFRRTIGGLLTQARRGQELCSIRVYGEMVDLLWKDGLETAAIRLETLWNQLASTQDFDLLCGYSMGHFYKGAALDEIKGQHTHLVADDGHAARLTSLAS